VAKRNQVSQRRAAMIETTPSPLGNVITIDDERIKSHLDRVVRGSVEETLNALLDAEADRLYLVFCSQWNGTSRADQRNGKRRNGRKTTKKQVAHAQSRWRLAATAATIGVCRCRCKRHTIKGQNQMHDIKLLMTLV
jgi:hypothetical protein